MLAGGQHKEIMTEPVSQSASADHFAAANDLPKPTPVTSYRRRLTHHPKQLS